MDVYRACLDCGEPTPAPRCQECQAASDRRTDQQRGSRQARGYDRQWQRKSARVRREEPACAICGSTDDLTVDHITPKAAGGTDDRENLTTLCRKHNSAKGGRR